MKKLLACCLCLLMMFLFAACNSPKETAPEEESTDVSESDTFTPELSTEEEQVVATAIAIIKSAYADEGYDCEYIGKDLLKVGSDGTFYVNVNEDEEDTDEAFYALRLFTDNKSDSNADSEGTIARFYVRKSTGTIYSMDMNEGTLTPITAE